LIGLLRKRGITDERVLAAMGEVPRERFVPAEHLGAAFDDNALPIGCGQTISQPFMVALMTQELELAGTEKVLEIGTGSGYQTAILARLCGRVVTVERIAELAESARQVLESLSITNVEYYVSDGSLGCPEQAPFDRIIVTAAAPEIPKALYSQLVGRGRMVIPIGTTRPQVLQTITRRDGGDLVVDVCQCSFVPLIGAGAWPESAGESRE